MPTRTLEIVLAGDPASASRAFRKVEQDAARMGKRLDREGGRVRGFATMSSKGFSRVGVAATGMAAAGGGAVALLAKSFVSGATSINESLSKNEVLFGRFAGSVEQFANRSAKSFGISKQAALEATGTFGNLFVALDIGPKKSAGMSVALTKLAADLASFNNASPEEALEAIRSGLVGETEPLRRFGVNINDAALRTQALKMGLIDTVKNALTPQQKALAVNRLLFEQTTKAQGDFARTSGGLANQQRILKARFADAGAELGGKLMPFALKAVRAINSLFDSSTKGGRAIQTMGRFASAAAGWIKNAWADAVGTVRQFVRRNREDIQSVITAFRNLARFSRSVFDTVIDVIRPVLPHTKRILEGVVRVVRGLIRIVTGLINGDWSRVWDGAKDVVSGAFRAIRGVIGGAWALLRESVKRLGGKILGGIGDALSGLWRVIKNGISDGFKKGVEAAKSAVMGSAKALLGPFADLIGDGVGNAARRIGDGVGRMDITGLGGKGGLMGADPDLGPFAAIGRRFGLGVTSGIRPGAVTSSGNPSYHATGDALDMAGSPGAMLRFFQFARQNLGGKLRELIYTPGGVGIKDGRPYQYGGQVAADHFDHVHLAYTGPFGDGIGQAAREAYAAGFRGRNLQTAVAIAGPESRYRDRARLVTSREDSRGKWQINTFAHPWSRRLNLYNGMVNARAAYRVFREAGGFGPWTAFSSGSYRSYMDNAARAIASLGGGARGRGGGGARGGGGRTERESITVKLPQTFGPGRSLGPAGELVRAETQEARARNRDDLGGLIASRERQIGLKRLRLGVIRAKLKKKLTRKDRIRLLQEEGQLVEEIGALRESLIEYRADRDVGGATTITRAEELTAGKSDDAGMTGASDLAAELRALRAELVANRKFAERIQSTEDFQLKKYLADVFSGQIVGYGVVGRSFTPGTGVEYAY